MLSESSFIESSIFDLEPGFSIVESGFLKRESEHESGFFPSPGFLRVRVQVRVRVRSGFRSMPCNSNQNYAMFNVTKCEDCVVYLQFVLTATSRLKSGKVLRVIFAWIKVVLVLHFLCLKT